MSWVKELEKETALAAMSNNSINYPIHWILDFGHSNHMIGDMNKFQSMTIKEIGL